jgi:uncharacterized protein
MWKDLLEYIIINYKDVPKIVEVGVGNFPRVALTLQEHLNMDIIMTDIKPYHPMVTVDDINDPDMDIYSEASLIYSIRPPEELQKSIKIVADEVGADVIIKPYLTESFLLDKKFKLVNYKKAIFYKMCNNEMAD